MNTIISFFSGLQQCRKGRDAKRQVSIPRSSLKIGRKAIIGVLMLLCPVVTVIATDNGQISFNMTYSSQITSTNTSDLYTVVLPISGKLSVNVSTNGTQSALPDQGADVRWLNAGGTQIRTSSGGVSFPHNDFMDVVAGTYHIEIVGRSGVGYTGTYNLRGL